MLRSGEVETVKVHHLGQGRHEVLDELLLQVCIGISHSPDASAARGAKRVRWMSLLASAAVTFNIQSYLAY